MTERRTRIVRLESDLPLDEAIERHGHVPLPPYIERPDASEDAERYQTVFAREKGSVAAPTAGLHFTPELLSLLERRGVAAAEIVLHVGAGTFKPVEVDDPSTHVMHEEWYRVSAEAARTINDRRARGWSRVGGRHDHRADARDCGGRATAEFARARVRRGSSSGPATAFARWTGS